MGKKAREGDEKKRDTAGGPGARRNGKDPAELGKGIGGRGVYCTRNVQGQRNVGVEQSITYKQREIEKGGECPRHGKDQRRKCEGRRLDEWEHEGQKGASESHRRYFTKPVNGRRTGPSARVRKRSRWGKREGETKEGITTKMCRTEKGRRQSRRRKSFTNNEVRLEGGCAQTAAPRWGF